ncbi:MAG: transcriptional regulator [Pseudomonadales bacterium]|jgi:uncharacterized Zn finger protein|nr:transcriptional regulator [Pseudomonadales bacterium]MDP6471324.1 transcriptional regulator [Pseudomonadales bacterium]MDP6826485.1 transcriptional regulator [Pseudomonadales bacterium]MDP6970060.1 transcriptional regulator [Pseudomonadales bacterium]|tara:strand:+ start:978 stop:1178 length:201 start_codon:yes stop_codon:yes gene_type:complete
MAEPMCPNCKAEGVEHIVSKESRERSRTRQPWFLVVHCDVCGHIYDILAKHTFAQPIAPKFTLPKP